MSIYRSKSAKLGISIPASQLAKWKTFIQDWAIAFCVIPLTAHHLWIATTTIWVAVVLTLYTGWQYYALGKKVVARAR
jgi:phosphatidylglycerophosphate synthase